MKLFAKIKIYSADSLTLVSPDYWPREEMGWQTHSVSLFFSLFLLQPAETSYMHISLWEKTNVEIHPFFFQLLTELSSVAAMGGGGFHQERVGCETTASEGMTATEATRTSRRMTTASEGMTTSEAEAVFGATTRVMEGRISETAESIQPVVVDVGHLPMPEVVISSGQFRTVTAE